MQDRLPNLRPINAQHKCSSLLNKCNDCKKINKVGYSWLVIMLGSGVCCVW